MKSEKIKILVVLLILVTLLLGIKVIRDKRQQQLSQLEMETKKTQESVEVKAPQAEIIVTANQNATFGVRENVAVNVGFKAPNRKIFGADVVLLYDPEFLSVDDDDITMGDFFSDYPRKTIDMANGIIKVTAYNGKDEVLDFQVKDIFRLNFIAVAPGSTKVTLVFTKGETNTTTLVEADTSENILEKVGEVVVNIEEK